MPNQEVNPSIANNVTKKTTREDSTVVTNSGEQKKPSKTALQPPHKQHPPNYQDQ